MSGDFGWTFCWPEGGVNPHDPGFRRADYLRGVLQRGHRAPTGEMDAEREAHRGIWRPGCGSYPLLRGYAAAKAGQRIDRMVRIWRDHTIALSVRDICLADGIYYLIRKITPTTDEDGLLVIDLDLEDNDGVIRGYLGEDSNR